MMAEPSGDDPCVGHRVEELVQPEQDRYHRESQVEDLVGDIRGSGALRGYGPDCQVLAIQFETSPV